MSESPLIRVLMVDDDPSVRQSLSAFLDDYGFDVLPVGSAEEALDKLALETFDLAIVDLRLPGMSGDTMILQARELSTSLRFLIHTGSKGFHLTEDLLSIGMRPEHVFLKPLADLRIILDAINRLFEGAGCNDR